MMQNKSELANWRKQVEEDYQAAQLEHSGLAPGSSQYQEITAKMEQLRAALACLSEEDESPEEAEQVVAAILEALPEPLTRDVLLGLLERVLHHRDETSTLSERIQQLWETRDLLSVRFGAEAAHKITQAPVSVRSEREEGLS